MLQVYKLGFSVRSSDIGDFCCQNKYLLYPFQDFFISKVIVLFTVELFCHLLVIFLKLPNLYSCSFAITYHITDPIESRESSTQ